MLQEFPRLMEAQRLRRPPNGRLVQTKVHVDVKDEQACDAQPVGPEKLRRWNKRLENEDMWHDKKGNASLN
jgi:hypothetical protein